MPSSSSSVETAPVWRATRKCGSSAIESSEQNGYTTRLTLPAAQSNPMSGPPYETIVRSFRSDCAMARMTAHRLAPRSPAPDADRHAVAQLRDDVFFGGSLVAHSLVSVSRLATNASRCSSATPDRFSSNVKPCSNR